MKLPPLHTGAGRSTRWALSFADLCLLLLGFLLLVQAHKGNPAALGAGIRAAFGAAAPRRFEETAAPSFEPGEAVLTMAARARYVQVGQDAAANGASVRIESIGTDNAARRFDGWELAAARTAAIARAVQQGGVDASRIDLTIAGTGPSAAGHVQRVRVTVSPASS